MKKSTAFLWLFFLLGFCRCTPQEDVHSSTDELDNMIGSLIMVGFRGASVSDTSLICRQIRDLHLGGVILFEYDVPSRTRPRNITSARQLRQLTDDLKQYGREDIWIAVDEEGGLVSRLKERYGYPGAHSPQTIGEIGREDSTRAWAAAIVGKVKSAGLNVNFAPVVDVNVNPESPVIGKIERSFSADPDSVAMHARIFIEEHRKEGILCSLKHFPGHGSATSDSHEGFTDVTGAWTKEELMPYKKLIANAAVDAVMTAHVYNADWDTVPATLSQKVVTDLLRKELGWQGLVFSDDMQMGAVTEHFGFEKGIELTLNAGVDILLFSNNSATVDYDPELPGKAFGAIKKLVEEGRVSRSRIEESYSRVRQWRQK